MSGETERYIALRLTRKPGKTYDDVEIARGASETDLLRALADRLGTGEACPCCGQPMPDKPKA